MPHEGCDFECALHVAAAGLQVARPACESARELGARREDDDNVGGLQLEQNMSDIGFEVSRIDVGAHDRLEFRVYIYGEQPEVVESSADARPPHSI